MSYYGTQKPVIIYGSTLSITGFANQGGGVVRATTSTNHNLTSSDYVYIFSGSAGNYDGFHQTTNVTATTFDITTTWVATETASCRASWNLQTGAPLSGAVNCSYIPDWFKDRIVNQSPINGYVSSVELADDDDKGRMTMQLELYNLSASQFEILRKIRSKLTIGVLLHNDNSGYTTPMLYEFVITNYATFQGDFYPIYDNATMTMESREYEDLNDDTGV